MTIRIDGTDGITPATWTTATRPSSPSIGQTGFNTTLGSEEYFDGSAWVSDKDGAWTTYTPAWTTFGSTPPQLGNGFLEGRYVLRGKTCSFSIRLTFGSTTVYGNGGWRFSLPFMERSPTGGSGGSIFPLGFTKPGIANGTGFAVNDAANMQRINCIIAGDPPSGHALDLPTTGWAAGQFLSINGTYEIA